MKRSGRGSSSAAARFLTSNGRCWRVQRSRRIWLSRPFGFWSWDDFLHQRGLLGAAALFTLLPLRVVVVKRWGQHRVWQHATAERQREPEPSDPAALQDLKPLHQRCWHWLHCDSSVKSLQSTDPPITATTGRTRCEVCEAAMCPF